MKACKVHCIIKFLYIFDFNAPDGNFILSSSVVLATIAFLRDKNTLRLFVEKAVASINFQDEIQSVNFPLANISPAPIASIDRILAGESTNPPRLDFTFRRAFSRALCYRPR